MYMYVLNDVHVYVPRNEVLEYDETHPKRQFIREVLSRCVRLAYWERVQPTIPAEFMVLMPDQPSPG